jgi:hypothetical protein
MSILTYRPQELIENRKAVSDAINNTDELSFSNSKKKSTHGEAAMSVRERASALEIQRLCMATDTSELEEMLKEL